MTIEDGRKKIINAIHGVYEENEAKNISELLIEYITRLSRIESIIKKNESLTVDQANLLNDSLQRLQTHEPVQYIINEGWFAGMKFYVDKNVLIPRPETEELVEWILQEYKRPNAKYRILDIGTGAGCIAIALKKKLPSGEIWACDISTEALNIARINADSLDAAIDFVGLDFLDEMQRKQLPRVDVIVSNPPYIPFRDKSEMRMNVVDYEPSIALFVRDDDPLIFYKAIADFGKEKLNERGKIYMEINETFAGEIKGLFHLKGYPSVEVKKDLQGKNRMIKVSSY